MRSLKRFLKYKRKSRCKSCVNKRHTRRRHRRYSMKGG